MCGRYVVSWSKSLFETTFNVEAPLFESYNLAPTQHAPILYTSPSGTRESMNTKWGLVPSWVKNPQDFKASLFNARAESLSEKASFKKAFKQQRCIVPASGFFEWKATANGKVPHYIKTKDNSLLAFAGLYEVWQKAGQIIKSHTIITTTPNEFMRSLHNRMPVILSKEQFDLWLDPTNEDTDILQLLLKPFEGELAAYRVNRRVGNVRENNKRLIEPSES